MYKKSKNRWLMVPLEQKGSQKEWVRNRKTQVCGQYKLYCRKIISNFSIKCKKVTEESKTAILVGTYSPHDAKRNLHHRHPAGIPSILFIQHSTTLVTLDFSIKHNDLATKLYLVIHKAILNWHPYRSKVASLLEIKKEKVILENCIWLWHSDPREWGLVLHPSPF